MATDITLDHDSVKIVGTTKVDGTILFSDLRTES